jgi:cobalt/nickel transport system permease protein
MNTPILLASPELLHIPDGFLGNPVSLFCWILSLIVVAIAVRRAQADYHERLIPVAGVMAAFIFAAQMLNFPVLGGTSGHLIGAALAFIVLGPWLGLLVMVAVIGLQALLFQDGGLVAMGANILVMGIVPGFSAYGIYTMIRNRSENIRMVVAGAAAWLSVVLGALLTSILLGVSGTADLSLVLPLMVGVHMLIGLGEALVTMGALAFLLRTRPGLLGAAEPGRKPGWAILGLGITLLVVLLAPLASASPDGLEWVAGQGEFLNRALDAPFELLPDYSIPGLQSSATSTILAGLVGVLIVGGTIYLFGRFMNRIRQR